VIPSETRPRRGLELRRRYSAAEVDVLTEDEAKRFAPGESANPRSDITLAWELLYRLEPELYERLVAAERLHPGVVAWLPHDVERIVEVAAGTGRLTLELVERAHEVLAIEPAGPLREILSRNLLRADHGRRARVVHGFFDELPVADDYADLVVACSALTPAPGHGGEAGLAEMERVCKPGGCVVIVWPNQVPWLSARGYRHVSFDDGEMFVEFASQEEAAELTEIFYPRGAEEVRRNGWRRVPYEVLGVNPPRDLAYKLIAR
jgi:SAM-dependent methyltransferase